ncbi:hypothetical protein B0H13DRAFT_223307 [Mycena leptocephala]|nr:hypothetical protein B0H13DRAFT_223307 [Mycena leptocephala]
MTFQPNNTNFFQSEHVTLLRRPLNQREMPKKTVKQKAAANREAVKRNAPIPFPEPKDLSLENDPSFEPELAADPESDNEASAAPIPTAGQSKLKRKNPDSDLNPARESGKTARTTDWRERTGQTKAARAKNMQASVATLFKPVPNSRKVSVALAARAESEEPDSDIEMLDAPPLPVVPEAFPQISPPVMEPLVREEVLASNDCDIEMPTVNNVLSSEDVAGSVEMPAPAPSITGPEVEEFPASIDASAPKTVLPRITLPSDSEAEIKAKHGRLQKFIKKNRNELTKKAAILNNAQAAASILDLEALSQFNDKSKELALKRLKLTQSLRGAARARIQQIKRRIQAINPTVEASLAISHRCGKGEFYARSLRSMAVHLLTHGTLPEKQQGKGAHHESLLLIPAVHEALQEWVKGTLDVDKGGFVGRMRPAKMRRYVNDFLLPELKIANTISESTAVRWLKRLGFRLARVQKGVYVDGHERPDVVKSREELIEYLWLKIFPFCYKYEGESLEENAPSLKDGEKIHYVIAHDECCVHANDQVNFEWMREGEQPLRNKSRGRIVHVSDFILEQCGRLRLNNAEIAAQLLLPKNHRRLPLQSPKTDRLPLPQPKKMPLTVQLDRRTQQKP